MMNPHFLVSPLSLSPCNSFLPPSTEECGVASQFETIPTYSWELESETIVPKIVFDESPVADLEDFKSDYDAAVPKYHTPECVDGDLYGIEMAVARSLSPESVDGDLYGIEVAVAKSLSPESVDSDLCKVEVVVAKSLSPESVDGDLYGIEVAVPNKSYVNPPFSDKKFWHHESQKFYVEWLGLFIPSVLSLIYSSPEIADCLPTDPK